MSRVFVTNSTLGYLRLSRSILRPRRHGGSLGISFRQSREADVKVTIRTVSGRVVRHVRSDHFGTGRHSMAWNVKNDGGKVVRDGRYLVRVRAVNSIGPVVLVKPVTVRRRF
jgi:flagellar hook assembly protein FlgD